MAMGQQNGRNGSWIVGKGIVVVSLSLDRALEHTAIN